MSTVLCFFRSESKLHAVNKKRTVFLDLSPDHPAAKLFPAGKDVVFAKCRVADGKVTVINPCKPWRK